MLMMLFAFAVTGCVNTSWLPFSYKCEDDEIAVAPVASGT